MIALSLIFVCLLSAACSQSLAAPKNLIAVTLLPSQPLTFYEGEDDIEPFTPFTAARGPQGSALTFGFAEREGAYYVTTYDAQTWQETRISNGFAPTDPLWDCDAAPEASTTFAPDAHLLARTCPDGSATVFGLPDALPLYHTSGMAGNGALTARTPAAVFAPQSDKLALTNDGPSGAGNGIAILDTQTWRALRAIPVSAGLLTRPAWSPDGATLAAVDLAGTLHIWNTATGTEIAHNAIPNVAAENAAADPDLPAPLWSPDGARLYVTTPTTKGALLTAWQINATAITQTASLALATSPLAANPQIAPDGARIFLHSGQGWGLLLAAPDLARLAEFALPGTLVIWGPDDGSLDAFTLNATVIPLRLGG